MDYNNTLKGAEALSAEIGDIVMMLSTMRSDIVDDYLLQLQQLDKSAKASGYTEIVTASQWCQHNLLLFKEKSSDRTDSFIESGECWGWLELISASLAEPEEASLSSALSTELLRSEWLNPYEVKNLELLVSQVKTNTCESDNDSSSSVASDVTTNNASLSFTWDADTHPEFLEAFFEETTELTGELAALLLNISKAEVDGEGRHNASRLAHTIKGGCAVAGITALSQFSYRLEKILEYSVKHELADDIYPLLLESSLCLEELFHSVIEKTGEPNSFASVFNRLSDYAETLEEDTEPLTLGKPKLPDFITQQMSTESTPEEIDSDSMDEEDEASDAYAELYEIIMMLSTISTADKISYSRYIEELRALDAWAERSGYSEVAKASQWCQQNLTHFEEKQLDKSEFIESGECWLWLELISVSLSDPEESSHLATITAEFMRDEWDIPFAMEDLQNLLMQLKGSVSSDCQKNQTDTTSENIIDKEVYRFSWDDDVHPELLSSYLQETPDQISQAASLLIKISKGEANKSDHQQAARLAHTIKGASGVVGISALVEFTHRLEDILDYSVNHQLPKEISILLAESSDCLEETFDVIQNKEVEPEEFAPLLSKLTEYSETLEQDDLVDTSVLEMVSPELPGFITNANNEQSTSEFVASKKDTPRAVDVSDVVDTVDTHKTAASDLPTLTNNQEADLLALLNASNAAKPSGAPIDDDQDQAQSEGESYIRVPVSIIDKLLNLAGELVTSSTLIADKIDKSIATSKQAKAQDHRVHKMLDELDTTLLKQEKEQFKVIASMQDKQFDNLEMDTYNELHSISGLLTESILDSETIEANLEKQLYDLKDDLHLLDLLNQDLSEVILNSRMVSINSLVPRLERIVRQTSKKTQKKVDLVITGNEIDVDTDILNGLTDPLLHLLRNAIDHGIEYPVDRQAKEKDKTGKIKLEFSRQGNHIQMQLKDDGAGIDAEKTYQKAIEKGLVTTDQRLDENEKLQLILHAGLSTQDSVTDISGRGVGMDVVNNAVQALNGTLDIESNIDKGTTFTINIPLTLVTSATLLVSVSDQQVAIPSESIEQIYYLSPEGVIEHEQGYFVLYDDVELPIQSLATLIGLPTNTPDFSKSHTLLFINSSNKTHAVYIDEIISSRQTVIKSLSYWLDTTKGLIGACHLPDGGVAPVINLPKILRTNEKVNQTIELIQLDSGKQIAKDVVAKILVVDDSLSNRKALSLIIDQTEFDVVTAVDGLDALQIMNENQIDLVFTDLEMPRMNGIELTQAIRAWDDKKTTPVVMITSRTTSKHRQLAEKAGVDDYLTKPVVTETLLNSMHQWLEKAVA
ncbi:MAG: Signal transduction histidine kinase CheA (EC [uncultured Thiotrichaceae bacterium]|uniref:Chemotaxis protein CheA n=1 Tax=uncultured Thiotrichaceae bacterium TaxID=298394 RepID=A0A6S6RUR3_9GAMM|nr:MAG: Signal transduction histidine kinase CheA (EC [uncultured Thiotrichaceae bacterium]